MAKSTAPNGAKQQTLGEAIRLAGYRLSAIAEDCEMSVSEFSRLCTGRMNPTDLEMRTIRKVLRQRKIQWNGMDSVSVVQK